MYIFLVYSNIVCKIKRIFYILELNVSVSKYFETYVHKAWQTLGKSYSYIYIFLNMARTSFVLRVSHFANSVLEFLEKVNITRKTKERNRSHRTKENSNFVYKIFTWVHPSFFGFCFEIMYKSIV